MGCFLIRFLSWVADFLAILLSIIMNIAEEIIFRNKVWSLLFDYNVKMCMSHVIANELFITMQFTFESEAHDIR